MKNPVYTAVKMVLVLVILGASVGCEFIAEFIGPGAENTGEGRPSIPKPASYIAEVPLLSDELVIATVPIDNFVPTVTNAKDADGNDLVLSPSQERVQLVLNGNPTPAPTYNNESSQPLVNTPYLQLVRYWRRLGAVQRYSGATTTSTTRSVTRGSSSTETSSFGFTLGVSTTVSADALFASTSVTLSAEFSAEFENEVTVSESVTEEETFEVTSGQDENIVFTVWQLVEEYRIVAEGPGNTWIPYEDPGYTFLEADLEPLPAPTDETRKYSWSFQNAARSEVEISPRA